MLFILTRFCLFISCVIIFGCGKNINDKKVSSSSYKAPEQKLSEDLTLQVDEAVSSVKTFELSENAWFKLPRKLIAQKGNATGKRIKIYYNYLSSGYYEFHCTYYSVNNVTSLDLEKCESKDGHAIISSSDDLENKLFPMDKGSSVKVQLTNPSGTGMKIESVFSVDWK